MSAARCRLYFHFPHLVIANLSCINQHFPEFKFNTNQLQILGNKIDLQEAMDDLTR